MTETPPQRARLAARKALNNCLDEIRMGNSRAEAEIKVHGLVQCRAVYRQSCSFYGGLPSVEIAHIWVDHDHRRLGVASSILWEIQTWLVSNGIEVAGIFCKKEFATKHPGVTELFEDVGEGRMERKVRGVVGFKIE